jgi:hypothetical protein
VEERFRAQARDFGLADRILQLPFLPHWRVPEFIRGCLAVCCLEQDFPIRFHSPIMPREVLLCGTCLVAATEVIRKLPHSSQLPHGFGCVAVENVNDVEALTGHLAAIVEDPAPASDVGARGREFACSMQRNVPFPQELERALEAAAAGVGSDGQRLSGKTIARGAAVLSPSSLVGEGRRARFWLCQLAAAALERADRNAKTTAREPVVQTESPDLAWARHLLIAIEERIANGEEVARLMPAVQVEIAIASAEHDADATSPEEHADPLFRLRIARWGMAKDDLARLLCIRDPRLRVLTFDFDVTNLMAVRNADDLRTPPASGRSYMVAFARCAGAAGGRRDPLVIDAAAARILDLSNGRRSAAQISAALSQEGYLSDYATGMDRIEKLFSHALISLLQDERQDAVYHNDCPAFCDVGHVGQ